MKISVLTPSFHAAKTLPRAIESAQAQRYTGRWEHIIMDGGSQDGTVEVLKSYPHLTWESQRDNGQSDAMNKAFQRSSGDIIVYLNADDELEPGAFDAIVQTFKGNARADMVVGKLRVVKPEDTRVATASTKLSDILAYSALRFPLNPAAYAYHRNVQERIGPFPVDNHYAMDYWFLLRAYLLASIATSDAVLGTYHFDGRNKSADGARAKKSLAEVRSEFVREHWHRPKVLAALAERAVGRLVAT